MGCAASAPIDGLTRVVENAVTTTYCYDPRGNVVQKKQDPRYRQWSCGRAVPKQRPCIVPDVSISPERAPTVSDHLLTNL
jgi:hypothetical protein